MPKPIYPIYHTPTARFAQRVVEAAGAEWTVSGLEIVQYARGLYEAHFMLRKASGGRAQKVEVGPKHNRAELLVRVVEFLKA